MAESKNPMYALAGRRRLRAISAIYVLQCIADGVRAIPTRPRTPQAVKEFVERVLEAPDLADPDMLNDDERDEARSLAYLFEEMVRKPEFCLPNVTQD